MKTPGPEILNDPLSNTGTAFTSEEPEQYGLEGYLPIGVDNEEAQIDRVREHLNFFDNDLQKFIYLASLQERNKKLFYRL